ncbi:MAG TPA: SGNH/GDSL hydrolase family protein, partial [Rhizomicrobium sp.]|nr:SGNH/GDSL hydrolase family protein [Rhizomicrobium sp.]
MKHQRHLVILAAAFLLLQGSSAMAAEQWLGAWGYPSAPVPASAKAMPVTNPVIVTPPAPFLIENPGGLPVVTDPPADPANVTLRQLVRVSVAGKRIRLHFSNEDGAEALALGAVHVGLAGPDGTIVAGTDRTVTFGGREAISIPSWAPYDSDPVDLPVAALDRLAISIFLPTAVPRSGHATYQYVSGARGDQTALAALPSPSLTRLRALVSRVDVAPLTARGAIVTLGDSITEGAHSTINGFRSWPDRLAERLAPGGQWSVVNAGIGGNRLVRNLAGPNALARFDRDVLATPGVKILVLMEGINDIGRTFTPEATQEPATLDDLEGAVRQIVTRAHDHGIKIYGATLTPYRGAHYYAEPGGKMRQSFNDWIRNSGTFDGVIDFDAALRSKSEPDRLDPAYDS